MKDEKRKNVFFRLPEKITAENQISWLLRREMQLRMSKTSDGPCGPRAETLF